MNFSKGKKADEEELNIVDRGAKTNIKDCVADKKKLLSLTLILALSIVSLIWGLFFKISLANYYQVLDKGKIQEMKQVSKDDIELTEAALISFVEDTVMMTFGLTYRDYNNQLNRVHSRYDDEAFNKLVKEMKRSNYINLIAKYHRTTTIIPTNTIYKIEGGSRPKTYEVFRSYMFETIGDNGVERHEVLYSSTVEIVEKTRRYFYGIKIANIHQLSLDKYIKEHGVIAKEYKK